MSSFDKDLIEDYHKTCLHILHDELDDAAGILSFYIVSGSDHPDKRAIPVKERIKPMLQSLPPGGFPTYGSFLHFIEKCIHTLNKGGFPDTLIPLN